MTVYSNIMNPLFKHTTYPTFVLVSIPANKVFTSFEAAKRLPYLSIENTNNLSTVALATGTPIWQTLLWACLTTGNKSHICLHCKFRQVYHSRI